VLYILMKIQMQNAEFSIDIMSWNMDEKGCNLSIVRR